MADMCLLGVIILSLLIGASEEEIHVFSSSGENVSLPCNHVLPDCTSTTWIYNRHRNSTVELFAGGIKKNIERHEGLSLGSDCSLKIFKATKEDHGFYTCRQYLNDQTHGTDKRVFLHAVQVSVSPSSTQNEIRPDSSVTLSCQLYSYEPCDFLVRYEEIQLVWKNQAGDDLQKDPRYQISSGNCIKTLTTRLLNEDNNTELRCVVTKRNESKTSASYTFKFKDLAVTNLPVTITNSETTTTVASETEDSCVSLYRVIIVIVVMAVLAAPTVILLKIVCARKAENRTQTSLEDTVMSTILF